MATDTVPSCPTHHVPMRENKRGWYCPTKVGSGWCDYKIKHEPPPAPAAAAAGPASGPSSDAVLMAASLRLAGTLWGQTPPGEHAEVIKSALEFYRAARAAL